MSVAIVSSASSNSNGQTNKKLVDSTCFESESVPLSKNFQTTNIHGTLQHQQPPSQNNDRFVLRYNKKTPKSHHQQQHRQYVKNDSKDQPQVQVQHRQHQLASFHSSKQPPIGTFDLSSKLTQKKQGEKNVIHSHGQFTAHSCQHDEDKPVVKHSRRIKLRSKPNQNKPSQPQKGLQQNYSLNKKTQIDTSKMNLLSQESNELSTCCYHDSSSAMTVTGASSHNSSKQSKVSKRVRQMRIKNLTPDVVSTTPSSYITSTQNLPPPRLNREEKHVSNLEKEACLEHVPVDMVTASDCFQLINREPFSAVTSNIILYKVRKKLLKVKVDKQYYSEKTNGKLIACRLQWNLHCNLSKMSSFQRFFVSNYFSNPDNLSISPAENTFCIHAEGVGLTVALAKRSAKIKLVSRPGKIFLIELNEILLCYIKLCELIASLRYEETKPSAPVSLYSKGYYHSSFLVFPVNSKKKISSTTSDSPLTSGQGIGLTYPLALMDSRYRAIQYFQVICPNLRFLRFRESIKESSPPNLFANEISETMQKTQQLIARLGIEEVSSCTKLDHRQHCCKLQWTNVLDAIKPEKPLSITESGTSSRAAKVYGRLKLLELTHIEFPLTKENREQVRIIQSSLASKDLEKALEQCISFIGTSSTTNWYLVIPNVWKCILSSYNLSIAEAFVDMLRKVVSSEFQRLPVIIWESMIDLCTVLSNGEFGYKALALLTGGVQQHLLKSDSTRFMSEKAMHNNIDGKKFDLLLDLSMFPSEEVCDYFQKYRAMLAFELRVDFTTRTEFCRYEDERLSSETCAIALDVVSGHSNVEVIHLHTFNRASIDRFLYKANLREDDLVLIRPNLTDEKDAWASSIVVKVSSVDVRRNELEIVVKLVTEEPLQNILGCNSFILYPLASSVGYHRMCLALRLLCFSQWPLTEKRPNTYFSPAMRFLLLYENHIKAPLIAQSDNLPEEFQEILGYTSQIKRIDKSNTIETHNFEDKNLLLSIEDAESLIHKLSMSGLTPSQYEAVRSALANRLTLIQGPPGTGKTYTACCIIEAWCKLNQKKRILAVADSNIAADNLSDGLKTRGIKSARVGAGTEMEIVHEYNDSSFVNNNTFLDYETEYFRAKVQKQEKWKASRALLLQNQVIITTCIGSGHQIFDNLTFERVVIDECAQSTEPANLVTLSRRCSCLVLIGDVNQLAATIFSEEAAQRGLHISLLKRFTTAQLSKVILLNVQRRMHPSIAEFPNFQFYEGSIRNQDVNDRTLPPIPGFIFPNPAIRVCLIKVEPKQGVVTASGGGLESNERASRFNVAEAQVIPHILASILDKNCLEDKDIGVLTPYDAQKRYIKTLLYSKFPKDSIRKLEVDTIDGFQGKEKELIIFSAVRSNVSGKLGFVVDAKRMNVMLTRARRGLIIIADPLTLKSEPNNWAVWVDWITARKGAISSDQLRSYLALSHPEPIKAEKISRAVMNGEVRSPWKIVPLKNSKTFTNYNLTTAHQDLDSGEDDGWD